MNNELKNNNNLSSKKMKSKNQNPEQKLSINSLYKVEYVASGTIKVGFLKENENGSLKFETIKGTSFVSKSESIKLSEINDELVSAVLDVKKMSKPEFTANSPQSSLFKYDELRDYIAKGINNSIPIPAKESKVDVAAIVEKHNAKKKASQKDEKTAAEEISEEVKEPKAKAKKSEPKLNTKSEEPKAEEHKFFSDAKSIKTLEEFESLVKKHKLNLEHKIHGKVEFKEVRPSRVNPDLLSVIYDMENGSIGGSQLVRLSRYFKIV